MQTILRWALCCLATLSFAVALPASAYLQFTYTSQSLPLSFHSIEGYPQDISEMSLPPPVFTLSFLAPEQDLSLQPLTHFVAANLAFSLPSPEEDSYIYYPIDIDPTSSGQISLNGDGTVAGWNLMVQMKELITPETNMELYEKSNHQISVSSNNDTGDQLALRFNAVTMHRDNWIQAAQLEFTFTNESERGTWTIEKVDLPEPGLAGLLVTGLTLLLWSRRKVKV